MTLKAHIDELSCLGHGDCAEVAPEAFVVDDVARATGAGGDDALLAAARACPAAAITLLDAATGEQVYP